MSGLIQLINDYWLFMGGEILNQVRKDFSYFVLRDAYCVFLGFLIKMNCKPMRAKGQ